jgi:hypothetical protein
MFAWNIFQEKRINCARLKVSNIRTYNIPLLGLCTNAHWHSASLLSLRKHGFNIRTKYKPPLKDKLLYWSSDTDLVLTVATLCFITLASAKRTGNTHKIKSSGTLQCRWIPSSGRAEWLQCFCFHGQAVQNEWRAQRPFVHFAIPA